MLASGQAIPHGTAERCRRCPSAASPLRSLPRKQPCSPRIRCRSSLALLFQQPSGSPRTSPSGVPKYNLREHGARSPSLFLAPRISSRRQRENVTGLTGLKVPAVLLAPCPAAGDSQTSPAAHTPRTAALSPAVSRCPPGSPGSGSRLPSPASQGAAAGQSAGRPERSTLPALCRPERGGGESHGAAAGGGRPEPALRARAGLRAERNHTRRHLRRL